MTNNIDTVTIALSRPIKYGEITVASLTFREATAGDACRADNVQGEFSRMCAVLCGMANISLPLMHQVPMRDMTKIISEVGHLMGEPQQAEAGST